MRALSATGSPTVSRLAGVGTGVLAGLVGGLLLTTVQAAARLLLGVSPPAELIGDRVAPLLTIDQFFSLFGLLGGYNGLKQVGIGGGTLGQLALGVVVAAGYAIAVRRGAGRATTVFGTVVGVLGLALVAALWPNLSTSYVGLSAGPARTLTIVVIAVSLAVFAGAVVLLVRLLGRRPSRSDDGADTGPRDPGRRALLAGGIGVGLAATTYGMGTELFDRATFGYDGTRVGGPMLSPITPNDTFYTVTKNVIDPRVSAGSWQFQVDGVVDRPRTWSLAELRALPQTTQETTLMCISNGVGDGLESNAMWTGVPLADLITATAPGDGVVEILMSAVDGYTDTIPIAKAMDPRTLLAFRMNGEELPGRHGFPARLVVPGMYGEKNLKWIRRVELVTRDELGFYETQGWGPDFVIPTRSRFTSPTSGSPVRRGDQVVLGGSAFGGDRGVSRVEVSTDGGASWGDARITYPGTRLSWALWSFDWRPTTPGPAMLVVRATDRDGGAQVTEERGIAPTGARGLHKVPVTVT